MLVGVFFLLKNNVKEGSRDHYNYKEEFKCRLNICAVRVAERLNQIVI